MDAQAQGNLVTGAVRDAKGEPVIGATVIVKGTATGATSGADGRYSIQAGPDATLEFSFIGYKKQEVPVGTRSVIDVRLEEDALMVDDVVVIGYGTQSRRTITAAVSKVDGEKLAGAPVNSIGDALKGRVGGVRVSSADNQPGSDPVFLIRGGSSINQSNAPIIIIDGVNREMTGLNPNDIESNWKSLSSKEDSPLLNRVVQGLYPPGSTIKPMIADAALTDGVTNASEIFDCDGVLDVGGGHTIRESHGEVHGRVDLRQAVTESCNITFGTLGMRMGDEKLKNAFSRFGFDREIGDEILMTKSHFPDFGKLSKGDQAQTAIGQSALLVTPMHMALLADAFANGGKVMKPYLVQDVITPGGTVVYKAQPSRWLTATAPEMASVIDSYMEDVVTKGTGTAARVQGVRVTGKTGTAENPAGKDHAWFIGSAELPARKIVFAIIVENGGGGGTEAAPIARDIIESLM